ncbi:hypothetical protein FHX57_006762 [Paraburkholderia tropica]|uniref:AP2 domain-containing protein n=1 Tax=Paraburkholderia tropica TaxID=92647 RepID=UPI00160E9D4C|nr:HNH endonuclease [Paraburkholderia tropica]MBB3004380.1 hypothetical protein [Paraburkholderia tropica]
MAILYTNKGQEILVDTEDLLDLRQLTWSISTKGYAVRSYKVRGRVYVEFLHRRLMGLSLNDGRIVDHIDGNPLNNQRSNLRECTHKENAENRRCVAASGYKGVYWRAKTNRWLANIKADGKTVFLGSYLTAEEAHRAYCATAARLHGEFANSGDGQITAERLREIVKGPMQRVTEEDRVAKTRGDLSVQATPVVCIENGIRFGSTQTAARWLAENGHPKASRSSITAVCRSRAKSAYGYRWRYATEGDA